MVRKEELTTERGGGFEALTSYFLEISKGVFRNMIGFGTGNDRL